MPRAGLSALCRAVRARSGLAVAIFSVLAVRTGLHVLQEPADLACYVPADRIEDVLVPPGHGSV
jgi:hypothetical protein